MPTVTLDTSQQTLAELLAAAAASTAASPLAVETLAVVAPVVVAPVVAEPVVVAPVVAAPVVAAPVVAEPVVAEPVVAEPVVAEPVVVAPVVAEPVVVPAIVAATPVPVAAEPAAAFVDGNAGMIVPSIPVLGQPSRAAASARPAQALLDQTGPVTSAGANESNGKKSQKRSKKSNSSTAQNQRHGKKKRRPFRAFLAFIVVAGLLGGAAYAGWYYFLRNKVSWTEDVEPLASFVETNLQSEFTDNVAIETLPVPEYEVKLGIEVLSHSYADADGGLTALRAVGLAGPTDNPSEAGRIVAAVRTSFYDPVGQTIYRLEGSTPVHEYGMIRSLAAALIDQQFAWSTDFGTLTNSQQVGVLAVVGSIAGQVADARAGGNAQNSAGAEQVSRLQAVSFEGDQIPLYVRTAMWVDLFSIVGYPLPPAGQPLEGLVLPVDDAVVFDLTRESVTPSVTVPAPVSSAPATTTMGMQFWYQAMVPALGAVAAHDAALLWAGDSTAVTKVNNFACITSNIATASEANQAALSAALMQWSQTRPVSSAAVVSSQPASIIAVSMCEPAEGGTDALGDATVLQFAFRASNESDVAQALLTLGLPDTRPAWNCAVLARRNGALADYTPGTVDPVVVAAMNDIVRFCSS